MLKAPDARHVRGGLCVPALVAMSLGYGVVQLDVSAVNVAIRPIGSELGGATSSLQWIVDAYTIALAGCILTAGALGDRIGARRVFIAGFMLFICASAACGAAPSIGALIACRAVQGVGAGILIPGSLTLLNHTFDDDMSRARAVGWWAAGASVALSAGPVIGGVLTAGFGWRAIFFINVPLGLFAIILTLRYIDETTSEHGRGFDIPGQVLSMIALVALSGGVIEGGARGFRSPVAVCGYLIAAVAGTAFIRRERRTAHPMLPIELFSRPVIRAVSAIAVLVNIGFYGLIFVLSLYLQRTQGRSPLETGLCFAPMTAIVLVTNLLSGRVSHRFGPAATIVAGTLAGVFGYLSLLVAGPTTPYVAIVLQMMVIGAGLGLVVPAMTTAMLSSVAKRRSGVASATLNTLRQVGSVIGVALFGAISTFGPNDTTGLAAVLIISAATATAAAAIAGAAHHESRLP